MWRIDRRVDRLTRLTRRLARSGYEWDDIKRVTDTAYRCVVDTEETSFGNYL